MQGGFIWEWLNHVIRAKDDSGRDYWAYGGDIGGYQYTHDGNFCADGLVGADRSPHPGMKEVKKVYQDILFHAKDLSKGIITIENRFHYTDLKNYDFKWEIFKNGNSIATGDFSVVQPAGTKKDITIDLPDMPEQQGVEYFLNVFAYTKNATEMIPAEYEIAREEFAFPVNAYFPFNLAKENGTIEVLRENDNSIQLKAGEITIGFSKRSGTLTEYSFRNQRLLSEGPQPDFWRAPTDNDYGDGMPEKSNIWRMAGKNKILKNFQVGKSENVFIIHVDYELNDVSSPYSVVYTISNTGKIKVQVSWKAGRQGLPEMPRFGMQMRLPSEFDTFTYYGRGPWENYSDRNTSSFIGIYNSSVKEQQFDYFRPQENGNKTDVRWLTLTNKDGFGLKIKGLQPLSVKAAHNPSSDLDFGTTKKNSHPSDITPRKEVYLNVDLLQRGVGGDDSWGAMPHPQYLLKNDSYEYGFEMSVVY